MIARDSRGRSRGYRTWEMLRYRCDRPTSHSYKWYGALGIRYPDSWRSFAAFIADMGEPPAEGYTLDRIDGSKDYSKENCRWASKFTQVVNARGHADGTSRFKGVSRQRHGWRARIRVGGDNIYLGFFADEIEAALAYNSAAKDAFGEIAFLNDVSSEL